jgi:hypothetical protein
MVLILHRASFYVLSVQNTYGNFFGIFYNLFKTIFSQTKTFLQVKSYQKLPEFVTFSDVIGMFYKYMVLAFWS